MQRISHFSPFLLEIIFSSYEKPIRLGQLLISSKNHNDIFALAVIRALEDGFYNNLQVCQKREIYF